MPGAARREGLGRATWAVAAALSLAALVYTFALSSARYDGKAGVRGDAHYVYVAAVSLTEDADIDLRNQYATMGDRWGHGRDRAADGWSLPVRELGPSLLMMPGLVVHHALGAPPPLRPSFAVSLAAMCLGLVFAGCAACLEALRRGGALALSTRRRDGLALAATLGFVVPYYCLGTAGYAHAPDAAASGWMLAAVLAGSGPLLVGLGLAAALLMRLQNALWVATPATVWLLGPRPWRPGAAVAALAVAAVGVLPQIYTALAHPGSQRGAIRWGLDFFNVRGLGGDVVEVLVGVHGLITWTPIAGLALVGLVIGLGRRDTRAVAAGLLVTLAALTLLFACARDPNGGYAFGARRHAGCTATLAVGLALLSARLAALPRGRALTGALDVLLVGLVIYNLVWTEMALRGLVKLQA